MGIWPSASHAVSPTGKRNAAGHQGRRNIVDVPGSHARRIGQRRVALNAEVGVVLTDAFIEDAASTANRSLAVAERIPCESKPRRPVV